MATREGRISEKNHIVSKYFKFILVLGLCLYFFFLYQIFWVRAEETLKMFQHMFLDKVPGWFATLCLFIGLIFGGSHRR